MVAPGTGLSITVCGSCVNCAVAAPVGGLDPVPVPVNVRLVPVPGGHPNVPTETVAIAGTTCPDAPATVTAGLPIRYAQVPARSPRFTVPGKLA
jgi:hypothetical protein